MLPVYEKRTNFLIWTISQNMYKIPILIKKVSYKLLKWNKYTVDKTWKTTVFALIVEDASSSWLLMLGLSAQLVLLSGDDVLGDNNDRASASIAPILSLCAISACLKLEIWSESFQSFFEISNHPFTTKPKLVSQQYLQKTLNCKWKKWQLSGQFAVNSSLIISVNV